MTRGWSTPPRQGRSRVSYLSFATPVSDRTSFTSPLRPRATPTLTEGRGGPDRGPDGRGGMNNFKAISNPDPHTEAGSETIRAIDCLRTVPVAIGNLYRHTNLKRPPCGKSPRRIGSPRPPSLAEARRWESGVGVERGGGKAPAPTSSLLASIPSPAALTLRCQRGRVLWGGVGSFVPPDVTPSVLKRRAQPEPEPTERHTGPRAAGRPSTRPLPSRAHAHTQPLPPPDRKTHEKDGVPLVWVRSPGGRDQGPGLLR